MNIEVTAASPSVPPSPDSERTRIVGSLVELLDSLTLSDRGYQSWTSSPATVRDAEICRTVETLKVDKTNSILFTICRDISDDKAAAHLENLARLGMTFSERWTVNSPTPFADLFKQTVLSPLSLACINGRLQTVKALIRLGADIDLVNSDKLSPLVFAATKNHQTVVTELLRHGADPDLIDLDPRFRALIQRHSHTLPLIDRAIREKRPVNPGQELGFELLRALIHEPQVAARLQELFRENGKSLPHLLESLNPEKYIDRVWKALEINPDEGDREGLTLLGRALANGNKERMRRTQELGSSRLLAYNHSFYQLPGASQPLPQEELTKRALTRMEGYGDTEFTDAVAVFNLFRSPYQLFLFTEALEELKNLSPTQLGLSLYQLSANLATVPFAKRPLTTILKNTATLAEHPNESDFLLLLNNSASGATSLLQDNPVWVNFFPAEAASKYPVRKHWALSRIGVQTYSFRRWQADALSVKDISTGDREKSLLEEFGAERIATEPGAYRPGDQFGSQFVFSFKDLNFNCKQFSKEGIETERSRDPESLAIMRRGYHLISNPTAGLLVIRNSSPDFGRDLLPQTAYYYPPEVSRSLTPESLYHPGALFFSRAMNPISITDPEMIEQVNFLIDELAGLQRAYSAFKFDTSLHSAWEEKDGTPRLTGGHRSPGFKATIRNLEMISAHAGATGQAVSLAFINPDFPPDRPYTFNSADRKEKTLLVDREIIAQLRSLAEYEEQNELPIENNVRDFLQHAGLDKQSELLIMLGEA